jgi:hypothetical protein
MEEVSSIVKKRNMKEILLKEGLKVKELFIMDKVMFIKATLKIIKKMEKANYS